MCRPIAIVASSRKGNWMLMSALARHPRCYVHEEQWFSRPEFAELSPREAVTQLFESPSASQRIVHSHYPLPYKKREANAHFYELLVGMDATFVFLRRANMVRWFASLELARRDRRWDCRQPPNGLEMAINLDCTAFLSAVAVDERAYKDARNMIGDKCRTVDVTYESFAAGPFAALQTLQLDLELPRMPLMPRTFKQHDRPLRDLINNYDKFADDLRVSGSAHAAALE